MNTGYQPEGRFGTSFERSIPLTPAGVHWLDTKHRRTALETANTPSTDGGHLAAVRPRLCLLTWRCGPIPDVLLRRSFHLSQQI
jgi:hypothetical protein